MRYAWMPAASATAVLLTSLATIGSGVSPASPRISRLLRYERKRYREYLDGLTEDDRHYGAGQGIVMVGGRTHGWERLVNKFTVTALLSIARARWSGCKLPVELWHDNDPALMTREAAEMLLSVGNVVLRNFYDLPGGSRARGYQLTLLALGNSAFAEALYLDADNFVIDDPTPIFQSPAYVETGAVFWLDMFSINPMASLWELSGQEPRPVFSIEVGQVLVNLNRHWKEIKLTAYFNRHGPRFYYNVSFFDCELFLIAWWILKGDMHAAPVPAMAGDVRGGSLCGHTLLQPYPEEPWRPLFAHRCHDAFTESEGLRWRGMKYFSQMDLPPALQWGMQSPENWKHMLEDLPELLGAVDPRAANSLVQARALSAGWNLELTEQCTCIDRAPNKCWDTQGAVARSPSSRSLVLRLQRMEARIRRLLLDILDRNRSSLRPGWVQLWARHVR